MQFLVQLETTLPPELPDDERAALLAAEAERGRELRRDGVIASIWRLPGRLANVGIWEVAAPDELHDAVTSLPLWRWMTVTVTPLARHPLM
jgi:muconolactone D-isomerase